MIDDQTYKKLKKCTCLNLGDFITFCEVASRGLYLGMLHKYFQHAYNAVPKSAD